jgi:hypothetical protein
LPALPLPEAAQAWQLVAPGWLLVRTANSTILVAADGQWFYLPPPTLDATSGAAAE